MTPTHTHTIAHSGTCIIWKPKCINTLVPAIGGWACGRRFQTIIYYVAHAYACQIPHLFTGKYENIVLFIKLTIATGYVVLFIVYLHLVMGFCIKCAEIERKLILISRRLAWWRLIKCEKYCRRIKYWCNSNWLCSKYSNF